MNMPLTSNEMLTTCDHADLLAFELLSNSLRSIHKQVFKREGLHTMADEENTTGNNLIWAVTLIIVVALIAGALYYSGFLGGTKRATQKIDVEVSAPSAPSR